MGTSATVYTILGLRSLPNPVVQSLYCRVVGVWHFRTPGIEVDLQI